MPAALFPLTVCPAVGVDVRTVVTVTVTAARLARAGAVGFDGSAGYKRKGEDRKYK